MAILKHARCPVVENLIKTGWVCTACKYTEVSAQPEICPKCQAVVEPNYGFEAHKTEEATPVALVSDAVTA